MNIVDPEAFLASVWDWSFLNDCFHGTNIRITDIDGHVERKGHFLYFETKGPNVEVSQGQMIMFKMLTKDHAFDVIIIWGNPNKPQRAQIISRGKEYRIFDCDTNKLHDVVSRWFQYANKNGKKHDR